MVANVPLAVVLFATKLPYVVGDMAMDANTPPVSMICSFTRAIVARALPASATENTPPSGNCELHNPEFSCKHASEDEAAPRYGKQSRVGHCATLPSSRNCTTASYEAPETQLMRGRSVQKLRACSDRLSLFQFCCLNTLTAASAAAVTAKPTHEEHVPWS